MQRRQENQLKSLELALKSALENNHDQQALQLAETILNPRYNQEKSSLLQKFSDQSTFLHWALRHECYATAEFIYQHEHDATEFIESSNLQKNTWLHELANAVGKRDKQGAQFIYAHLSNLDLLKQRNNAGNSPLHLAAQKGNIYILNAMLDFIFPTAITIPKMIVEQGNKDLQNFAMYSVNDKGNTVLHELFIFLAKAYTNDVITKKANPKYTFLHTDQLEFVYRDFFLNAMQRLMQDNEDLYQHNYQHETIYHLALKLRKEEQTICGTVLFRLPQTDNDNACIDYCDLKLKAFAHRQHYQTKLLPSSAFVKLDNDKLLLTQIIDRAIQLRHEIRQAPISYDLRYRFLLVGMTIFICASFAAGGALSLLASERNQNSYAKQNIYGGIGIAMFVTALLCAILLPTNLSNKYWRRPKKIEADLFFDLVHDLNALLKVLPKISYRKAHTELFKQNIATLRQNYNFFKHAMSREDALTHLEEVDNQVSAMREKCSVELKPLAQLFPSKPRKEKGNDQDHVFSLPNP